MGFWCLEPFDLEGVPPGTCGMQNWINHGLAWSFDVLLALLLAAVAFDFTPLSARIRATDSVTSGIQMHLQSMIRASEPRATRAALQRRGSIAARPVQRSSSQEPRRTISLRRSGELLRHGPGGADGTSPAPPVSARVSMDVPARRGVLAAGSGRALHCPEVTCGHATPAPSVAPPSGETYMGACGTGADPERHAQLAHEAAPSGAASGGGGGGHREGGAQGLLDPVESGLLGGRGEQPVERECGVAAIVAMETMGVRVPGWSSAEAHDPAGSSVGKPGVDLLECDADLLDEAALWDSVKEWR